MKTLWRFIFVSGRLDDLQLLAHEALHHNPDYAPLHYNVANALGKASRFAESERHFLAAIRLAPFEANYHSNLGVLYHRWKKYEKAEAAYSKALQLNPKDVDSEKYRTSVRKFIKN